MEGDPAAGRASSARTRGATRSTSWSRPSAAYATGSSRTYLRKFSRPIFASAASRSRSGYLRATLSSRSFICVSATSLVRHVLLALEAPDQLSLHAQLAPVAGKVGGDEQRLAAARRDRHEPVEHDEVANRPRREHERERGDEQRARRDAQPHAAVARHLARARSRARGCRANMQVLGPRERGRAEQRAGHAAMPTCCGPRRPPRTSRARLPTA